MRKQESLNDMTSQAPLSLSEVSADQREAVVQFLALLTRASPADLQTFLDKVENKN